MQCHSALYPIVARSARTVPNPRPSKAVTFSTITSRGPISPIRRANSLHSPLRDPARPFPKPARLTSWQGNPPMIASGSIPSRCNRSAVSVRTSSYWGTPGKRAESVARASLSISHNATVSNPPDRSSPRSNAPQPANSERTRYFRITAPRQICALVWSCWFNILANERHLMLCAVSAESSLMQFSGQHGDAVANRAAFP